MLHENGEGSNAWFEKGCRCDECRAAKNKRNNIYRKANSLAATWVKTHYPRIYEEMLDKSYELYGEERPKNGGIRAGDDFWWNYNNL